MSSSCAAASIRYWFWKKGMWHPSTKRRSAPCATASMCRWERSATATTQSRPQPPAKQQHQNDRTQQQLMAMTVKQLFTGVAVQLFPGVVVLRHLDEPMLGHETVISLHQRSDTFGLLS